MALEELKNYNFIGALAMYQHRRDTAIGLAHITARQRGLIWYYNVLLSGYLRRAMSYGIMQAAQKRMAEIMAEAPTATLDRQRQLLAEAMTLEEMVKNAGG